MAKIALLGFGTVGSGVYEVIEKNAAGIAGRVGEAIEIKYILDIRDFSSHPKAELFTKNFDDILSDNEVTIVAELIGGLKPAYEFTKSSLLAGKSVVTSNKELVATYGAELLGIAKENGVSYLFEASVGGGIPIIKPLHQCLAANEITEILGILNGTTNYILTQMQKHGRDFADVLKEAQEKGYAEANPAADVEGHDAARKIAILSSLAFGKQVDANKIHTEGITEITKDDISYAGQLGYVIKLIGHSKSVNGRVFVRVCPMLLPEHNSLAGVEDVFNGILVMGNATGEVMFYGKGAGKLPTASAVVADIIDIVRKTAGTAPILWKKAEDDYLLDPANEKSAFFVRCGKDDSEIAKAMGFTLCRLKENSNEFAFILPKTTEKEAKKTLEGFHNVIKIFRVFTAD